MYREGKVLHRTALPNQKYKAKCKIDTKTRLRPKYNYIPTGVKYSMNRNKKLNTPTIINQTSHKKKKNETN